ncbi:MAG: macro domain-containing protein [Ruminococcus sp.]|nr:macro domain-containing protein [Ruminococcus sp.]
MPLQIIRQDITKIECDAIVNPTNVELSPTGGLDLAIHKASGEELLSATRAIGHIKVGEAVVTPAYKLCAKYVIHTAGPVYNGGEYKEEVLLRSCYKNALNLAFENSCESIAIPLISSGAYGYPKDKVLKIAIDTISEFLFEYEMMVYLVVFDKTSYTLSEKLLGGIKSFIDDNYAVSRSYNQDYSRRIKPFKTGVFPSAPMAGMASRPSAIENIDECCVCESKPLDIDDYIKLDESFTIKLLKLIDLRGMSDVQCYKKANVSKQTWYKIMNDKNYKPNKKTVLSFALALKLTLSETQNLLESVGFVLSNSSLFDVIIMYCLQNSIYDVLEIDSILFSYDQETLYSKF